MENETTTPPQHILEQEEFEAKVAFIVDLLDIEEETVMEAPIWAWHLAEKMVWAGWRRAE